MDNEYQITITPTEQDLEVTIQEDEIIVQMDESGPPGPVGPSTRRTTVLADAATVTPDVDLADIFLLTMMGPRNIANPIGTPVDGHTMIEIRITNGIGGINQPVWGSKYHFSVDQPEPALSTLLGATDYVGFAYNALTDRYDCLAVSRGH